MDLQELIKRGRFIMANAPDRLSIFELVNGKRNAIDIAKVSKRHVNNVRRDLSTLADAGLIEQVIKDEKPLKKDGSAVFDKIPLARTIPLRYFEGSVVIKSNLNDSDKDKPGNKKRKNKQLNTLPIPTEQEILDVAKNGETQLVEFKSQGVEIRKITREIAAMLNTKEGGQIFYGINDDGDIEGSDLTRQKLDQPLQNSVRNSISPSATIRIHDVNVMGSVVIVITVPPWNKKNVYMFDEKVLIRRGTNVFSAKTEDLRLLHEGKPIV